MEEKKVWEAPNLLSMEGKGTEVGTFFNPGTEGRHYSSTFLYNS